jgi:hypothetical protein
MNRAVVTPFVSPVLIVEDWEKLLCNEDLVYFVTVMGFLGLTCRFAGFFKGINLQVIDY